MDVAAKTALKSLPSYKLGRMVLPGAIKDTAVMGSTVETVPGFPRFGFVRIEAKEAATPEGRQAISNRMQDELKQCPSLTAVVGLAPQADGNTGLVVEGRPEDGQAPELQGIFEIIKRLASSDKVRAQAAAHPGALQPMHAFDPAQKAEEMTLGGSETVLDLSAELAEGGQAGRKDQIKAFVDALPKGQRVVILCTGPSGAGKSGVISDMQDAAGSRHVVHETGDNEFRNADDPQLPRTAVGGVDWDSPKAMLMDEFGSQVGKLAQTGHIDEPVYDFAAKPTPDYPTSGMRTDKTTPLDAGPDDLIVVDSLHSANPAIIAKLKEMGVPFATVYLDSKTPTIREVRRAVRDNVERGRSAEQTVSDWKNSTFPGELSYIRPQLFELVPGRDMYNIRQFPADIELTQAQIDDKVAVQKDYGVQPTYAAFKTADADMPIFARSEVTRLQKIVDDPATSADARTLAEAGLLALKNAPKAPKP